MLRVAEDAGLRSLLFLVAFAVKATFKVLLSTAMRLWRYRSVTKEAALRSLLFFFAFAVKAMLNVLLSTVTRTWRTRGVAKDVARCFRFQSNSLHSSSGVST